MVYGGGSGQKRQNVQPPVRAEKKHPGTGEHQPLANRSERKLPLWDAPLWLILILAFVGLVIWTWSAKRKRSFDEAAQLALDEKDRSIKLEDEIRRLKDNQRKLIGAELTDIECIDNVEGDDRNHRRQDQRRTGGDLGAAVAQAATEQAGGERARQRQEDRDDVEGVHGIDQPFIMLTSSTAIEPRLR